MREATAAVGLTGPLVLDDRSAHDDTLLRPARDLRRPTNGSALGSRAEGQQVLLGRVEPGRQQDGPALEPAGACQRWEQAIAQPPGRSPAQGRQVPLPTRTGLHQASELAADRLIAASHRPKVAVAMELLCQQAAENLTEYAEAKLEVHVILVDFDTLDPTGASRGALALTTWGGA